MNTTSIESVLFCRCPTGRPRVDEMFAREAEAVSNLGLTTLLLDHDEVLRGNIDRALRAVPCVEDGARRVIYRGWMIPAERYVLLHAGLQSRGYCALTFPECYEFCHHLPKWYPAFADRTPKSVWLSHTPPFDAAEYAALLSQLSPGAAIVKDFVKSEKHAWFEACFIPNVDDHGHARKVIDEFISRRGGDFEGGLVLRKFVALARVVSPARGHSIPPSEEWRVFWVRGEPVLVVPGFESATVGEPPDLTAFKADAARIRSPFFSMDLARLEGGEWIIVELGDGQVSGLPDGADPSLLFEALTREPR